MDRGSWVAIAADYDSGRRIRRIGPWGAQAFAYLVRHSKLHRRCGHVAPEQLEGVAIRIGLGFPAGVRIWDNGAATSVALEDLFAAGVRAAMELVDAEGRPDPLLGPCSDKACGAPGCVYVTDWLEWQRDPTNRERQQRYRERRAQQGDDESARAPLPGEVAPALSSLLPGTTAIVTDEDPDPESIVAPLLGNRARSGSGSYRDKDRRDVTRNVTAVTPGGRSIARDVRRQRDPDVDAFILAVFDDWCEVMHKNAGTILDASRYRTLAKARRVGQLSLDDARLALRGCAASAWHMGEDPRNGGRQHNDVTLIFRDAQHWEEFRRAGEQAAAPLPARADTPREAPECALSSRAAPHPLRSPSRMTDHGMACAGCYERARSAAEGRPT